MLRRLEEFPLAEERIHKIAKDQRIEWKNSFAKMKSNRFFNKQDYMNSHEIDMIAESRFLYTVFKSPGSSFLQEQNCNAKSLT